MKFEFTENAELEAKLMVAAKKSHDEPNQEAKEAAYDRMAIEAGVSSGLEAILRGIWFLKSATPEYRAKVNAALEELDPNYQDSPNPNVRIVHDGDKTVINLNAAAEVELHNMGLEDTPELREFVNQVAEAAVTGSPLAAPYVAAGAIKIFKKQIAPGIEAHGIGFHRTKFAEMLKSPASYMN